MKKTIQNSSSSNACLSCQIINGHVRAPGGIIFQNQQIFLAHNTDVDIPGYVIAAPIRHVENWSDLNKEEAQHLMQVMDQAAKTLETLNEVERVYICVFAEQTKHLHVHILPRYRWLLELDDVFTNNMPDGPKIFSRARECYLKELASLENPSLLKVVAILKKSFV